MIVHLFEENDKTFADSSAFDPKKWAVRVALDGHNLQSRHTLTNSLSAALQKKIKSFLKFVIASIDSNCNLDLIFGADEKSLCFQLFMAAFQFSITFDDYEQYKGQISVLMKYKFQSQFPFSWNVIPQIEYLCTTVLIQFGESIS